MKKLLSLLLAYAFLQAQTWAIGGGPRGGASNSANLIGTYSGVLIPTGETDPLKTSSASIGLFSVAVNASGPALGAAVVFIDGVAYIGDMIAVVDPKNSSLSGVVEAASNYTILTIVPSGVDANGNLTFSTVETKIFAQGKIEAEITGGGGAPINPLVGATATTARLEGTAALDLFSTLNDDGTPVVSNSVQFTVDGFKQSDTATTVTFSLTIDPNNNNNG